jgi:integrase
MQRNDRSHATGHVRLVRRKRGPDKWYARIRVGQRQINRVIGPAWTKQGRPPTGWFTKQTATATLYDMLAAMSTDAGGPDDVTFAEAGEEFLRYSEQDRQVRSSTLVDYRATVSKLTAVFGTQELTTITRQEVEAYKAQLLAAKRRLSPRTINRHLVVMGGVFRRAEAKWGIAHNPAALVSRQRERYTGINFYEPDDVRALVAAAEDSQDAALFLTAAMTGLRQGELLGLHWSDVDWVRQRLHVRRSFCQRSKQELSPKSGKVRSVPMAAEVVGVLDKLSKRDRWTDPDDLVFPNWQGRHQYHGDLRARFRAAQHRASLKAIRFHDLRHTFGTLAAQTMPLTTVKELMGHAHINTTLIYSHYVPAADEAERLSQAFRAQTAATEGAVPAGAR